MKAHIFLIGLLFVFGALAEDIKLAELKNKVEVHYDGYGVPHVFASSWTDAACALGYLHASDRLWQMDTLRRVSSGMIAEVFGAGAIEEDIRSRQLGVRSSCEEFIASDQIPPEMKAELIAYAAGVNVRIAELGDNLPALFKLQNYKPLPWTPVDSLVLCKYMAWDQSGTNDDLWFGLLVEKFGIDAVQELWPLDRPYEEPSVTVQAERAPMKAARMTPVPGAGAAYAAALEWSDRCEWLTRGHQAFGSNNWAVDGTKTASGKPIFCSDPHLGFSLPSLWFMCHVNVNGESVAGAMFSLAPFVVIGHNDHVSWGITNLQSDAVDYFVEEVDPTNPLRYKHRGEWKDMKHVVEKINVKGESAPREVAIDYTVHGPVISREGRTISMQWNGLGMTKDGLSLWLMNRAKNVAECIEACDTLSSPPLNMLFADSSGNIAVHPCGLHPVRMKGQGRIPMDGSSGDYDWVSMIPMTELPLAVNPPEHYVATANARPTGLAYPYYLGWMWDDSYRIRRIHRMLSEASNLTIDTMRAIQNDPHDYAAERNLPVLLDVMKQATLQDDFEKAILDAVSKWDYKSTIESMGTMIWLDWFDAYRKAVWDDEFISRGMELRGGSWGFSGNNNRQPMLEVLEFMTRENPESRWFDDQTTPEHETRDAIIERAFHAAAKRLKERCKGDVSALVWKNYNILRIRSLTEMKELAREGGPVPGDDFTVNPGGDGGSVGGGASWRIIVDFGDTSKSVGVYPGGQSEIPADPHYADLMPLWATGQYAKLNAVSSPDKLPADAKVRSLVLVP